MGTNFVFKHIIIEAVDGTGSITTASLRTVEVETVDIKYNESKKNELIIVPQTTQKWASGRKDIKIVDLLRITPSWEIKGHIYGDQTNKTTLSGSINSSVTTITMTDVTNLESASLTKPSYVLIDNELIMYTAKTGTTGGTISGCIRGYMNTTAATHSGPVDSILGAGIRHPAWHYAEMMKYIVNAGGCFIMLRGTTTDASNLTIANSYTLSTNAYKVNSESVLQALSPAALVKVVNNNSCEFQETPEDTVSSEVISFVINVTPGVNL